MDVHPFVGDVLSYFGRNEKGEVPNSEGRTALDCDNRVAYAQRRPNERFAYSFSVRLLNVTFISLVVAYFLLRCFRFSRERYQVVSQTRALATGGGRPCQGDTPSEGNGEGGEEEAFWIGELEGTSGKRLKGGSNHFRSSTWHTGHALGWPSLSATSGAQGFGGIHRLTSQVGFGAAASTLEAHTARSQVVVPVEYLWVQGSSGSVSGRRMGRHAEGAAQGRTHEGQSSAGHDVKLRVGETLQMWERRRLPQYAEQQVINLFRSMNRAASLCRSLFRVLTQSQRLHLAREVVRLLTLELGAFSLVQERLEPLRSKLGNILLQLSNEALQRSGQDMNLDESRHNIRVLIALLHQLIRPRPVLEGNFPSVYRIKMLSLLRTATEVIGFCVSVLEGLSQFEAVNKHKPSSDVIARQLRVLRQLYDVHSSYVARDSTLRRFIIECQKSIGLRPILCRRHAEMSSHGLPPMNQLVKEIHEAVFFAGGLPHASLQQTREPQGSSTNPASTAQQTPSHEPVDKEWMHTHRQDGSSPPFQPPPVSIPAGLHHMQAGTVAAPVLHTSLVHTRGGHPAIPCSSLQPGYETRNTEEQLQHFPSHPAQPVLGYSMPSRLPTPHSLSPALVHQTPRIPGVAAFTGLAPTQTPRYGSTSSVSPRHLGIWRDSKYLPEPQPSSTALFEMSAPVDVPGYPMHGGYNVSDQAAQHPVNAAAARLTEENSGGDSEWGYGTIQGGTYEREDAELGEEVRGLLGELLKGGLKLEDVFPRGTPPDI